jgi:hypothetical protein
VRRALGTYLELERQGGAGSAILAHSRPLAKAEKVEERELALAVTLKHYIHRERLDFRGEGMGAWTATVLDAFESERAGVEARKARAQP